MKYLMFILFFLFIVHTCESAPTVSSVDGSFFGGQSIEVDGSDFKTKTTSAPLIWKNFENGINGSDIPDVDSDFTLYNIDGGQYSNSRPYSGSLTSYNYVNPDITDNRFNTSYIQFTQSEEAFISYKLYYETSGAISQGEPDKPAFGQYKICRLNSSTSAGGGGVYQGAGDTSIGGNLFYNLNFALSYNNGVASLPLDADYALDVTPGVWHHISTYKKLSTAGVGDGIVFNMDAGSITNLSESAVTMASGETFKLDTVMLGLMITNVPSSDWVKVWIDDLYVDNTLSAVLIGDAPTLTSCSSIDYQIPTTWSDTSITVTFNQGAFYDGETVYLFVRDSDGNVSDGYEITIGSGESPANLIISGQAQITGAAIIN